METKVTATSNWQVFIPKAVRDQLKLEIPGEFIMKVQRGEIIITPLQSEILNLFGSLNKNPEKESLPLSQKTIKNVNENRPHIKAAHKKPPINPKKAPKVYRRSILRNIRHI